MRSYIYDAFETRIDAIRAAKDLGNIFGRPIVRRIKAQAGGRLKWGVFVPKY